MSMLIDKDVVSSDELELLIDERSQGKIDFWLVDVREAMEYRRGHIKGVDLLKPTSLFYEWSQDIMEKSREKVVIVTCRTDYRSGQIQMTLKTNGYPNIINHEGGIVSYRGETETL